MRRAPATLMAVIRMRAPVTDATLAHVQTGREESNMYDVMGGVRVIEVAEMLMAPAASMALADWGADVIKVERIGGDRIRTLSVLASVSDWNHNHEIANRGKRSVGIDLTAPEGAAILRNLLETADVFITSMRQKALEKLLVTAEDVTRINPKIIYVSVNGLGPTGPLAGLAGFDWPSSWCRAGTAHAQTPPNGEPPNQPGSVGDLMGGLTTAGAIAAALFRRERTGKGCVITNSLYHTGMFVMTQAVTLGAAVGPRPPDNPLSPRRDNPYSPTLYAYRTKDDRWIALCLLLEEWWPDFTRHIGREDFQTNPLFVTEKARVQNRHALIAELQKIFLTKTFEEWKTTLSTLQGVWAPMSSADEVAREEQALVNGYVTPITKKDGSSFMSVATPGQFDQRPVGPLRAAPQYGEHTDEVLLQLGMSAEQIASLRRAGHIG